MSSSDSSQDKATTSSVEHNFTSENKENLELVQQDSSDSKPSNSNSPSSKQNQQACSNETQDEEICARILRAKNTKIMIKLDKTFDTVQIKRMNARQSIDFLIKKTFFGTALDLVIGVLSILSIFDIIYISYSSCRFFEPGQAASIQRVDCIPLWVVYVEILVGCAYLFEYILKFIAAPSKLRYVLSLPSFLSLLCIYPSVITCVMYWGKWTGNWIRAFQNLQLLRIFRFIRLSKVFFVSKGGRACELFSFFFLKLFSEICFHKLFGISSPI